MQSTLAQSWWLLLLRGIIAIVFGVLALAWPQVTLVTLVLFYGAYALADGIIALAVAVTREMPARWWLVLVGVAGIGAGLLTFFYPGVTAILLVMFIGLWAVAHGLCEIVGAFQLRED